MRLTTSLRLAVAAALCATAISATSFAASKKASDEAPLATPLGVTVQYVGRVSFGLIIGYGLERTQQLAYANEKGMTLYTSNKDEPGKSNCVDACAKTWLPATPIAGATPFGNWTVITRTDGLKQWAFKDKPLYTYAKDQKISDITGRGLELGNWQLALFEPTAGIVLPPGFGVDEVTDANGQVLTNAKNMTVYAFDGNIKREAPGCSGDPCISHWIPVVAPELLTPVGDFTIVIRPDQTRQWAYKGKPLFSYDGDLETNYAAGMDIDKKMKPVVLVRYFMPPEATIVNTLGQGKVLGTDKGLTVYRRDAYVYQLGGHGIRRGVPPRPHVGRDIGTSLTGCNEECQKDWSPLKAPANAQPSGFWQIAEREDGTRQWIYKGYALYTYNLDKKPGDMLGNDRYDFAFSRDPNKAAERPSRMTAAGALFFMYAFP